MGRKFMNVIGSWKFLGVFGNLAFVAAAVAAGLAMSDGLSFWQAVSNESGIVAMGIAFLAWSDMRRDRERRK